VVESKEKKQEKNDVFSRQQPTEKIRGGYLLCDLHINTNTLVTKQKEQEYNNKKKSGYSYRY